MTETPEPDLEAVIDYRFIEIEAELSITLDHLNSLARQLPEIRKAERERLETELEDLEGDEWYGMLQ